MVEFDTIMLQFAEQGEKTGWTYIEIPADLAQQMKPGNKQSYRVKGMLDGLAVSGLALMPMGEGNFILALKTDIRKALRKNAGAMLHVKLEPHDDFKYEMADDLKECMNMDPEAWDFFNSLPGSHRNYFLKWVNDAKTSETRAKRIVNMVNAMLRKWTYNMMVREIKRER